MNPTLDAIAQARSDHALCRAYVERYGVRRWAEGMAQRSHDTHSDADEREYVRAYCEAYYRCCRKARRARYMPDLLRLIERAGPRTDWYGWFWCDVRSTGVIDCGGLDRDDSCDGATDAPHTCWRHAREIDVMQRWVRMRERKQGKAA